MTTKFRIIASIFTAAVLSAAATATTAIAADYVITWKNQHAASAICTLNASVTGPVTASNNITRQFSGLGQTINVTISSPTCLTIRLSASCRYGNAQGSLQTIEFPVVSAACNNNIATLNPGIPGSLSITNNSEKPVNVGPTIPPRSGSSGSFRFW